MEGEELNNDPSTFSYFSSLGGTKEKPAGYANKLKGVPKATSTTPKYLY